MNIDPLGLMNPNDMWYTQDSVSHVFSDGPWKGKLLTEAIESTRRAGALPEGLSIHYENIILPNGQEVSATLNNRTLLGGCRTFDAQQAAA